jgi:hypothetical protein
MHTGVDESCQNETAVTHYGTPIGEIVFWDHYRDIAYIEQNDLANPTTEVVYPADHFERQYINGTVSESGMGTVVNDNLAGKIGV